MAAHLSAQRLLHQLLEAHGVVVHHATRLLEAQLHRVIAAQPRVVQRGLVGAQLHQQLLLLRQTLPQVHHVAQVADRQRLAFRTRALDASDARVQVRDLLADPALLEALLQRRRVDLRNHADRAGNQRRLALRARHAAQTRRHEHLALQAVQVQVLSIDYSVVLINHLPAFITVIVVPCTIP